MPSDLKQELRTLRIDKEARLGNGRASRSRLFIVIGIALVALLSVVALGSRLMSGGAPEVHTVIATAEPAGSAGVVLNATGYIVAHHKINVNSKVTGRVAWIGVEKGDRVKQGQVLVRLEDDEFRAAVEQARGAVRTAEGRVQELEHGSRPEEIARAEHDLEEARATLADDRANVERARGLTRDGVFSKQQLDDAQARFDASQHRVNSLEKTYELAKLGPRVEQIDQARGDLLRAKGQLAFAQSQLDATQIRAPVNGTILERTAEKGELVSAQFASGSDGGLLGTVVSLADLTDIQAELDISQNDFAKLSPKQKAIVTTDAFPDRKYDGNIAEISPEANRSKATVQVKVQVLNPDDYLKPDMNATVQFLSNNAAAVNRGGVFVPAGSVRERDGKKVVWAVMNEQAKPQAVNVIEPRAGGFLVEGVTAGAALILDPPATLKPGDRVKIKK
jgi:HlyD family secretion protein